MAASRNADLALHFEAGEALSKMFFAINRIKYKRLWPRDIADKYDLRTNHPSTWKDLEAGNISVTKNEIPFVSIGADQKSSKVSLMWELARFTKHHDLGPSTVKREHGAINKIKAAILSHGNPISTEGDHLHNLITHAYILNEYVPQILNIDATGQEL